MAIIIDIIRQYAPWVYGVCALVALWELRVVLLARRERRYAVFNLERETALNRVYNAWTVAILLALTMGLVYVLSTVVSEAVKPLIEQDQFTPTPGLIAGAGEPTATPTLPLPETTPTATATRQPRPTPRPLPTQAPQVTPTFASQRPSCPDPRAVITAPGINAEVSIPITVLGTAVHENFSYYKLEYGPGANPADSQWSFFAEGNQPVNNGRLGALSAPLPPGTYSIRVVVVDTSGNFPPPCKTTIVIR